MTSNVNTVLYDIVTDMLTKYKESDRLHKAIVLDLVQDCLKRKREEGEQEEEEAAAAVANPGTSRFVANVFILISRRIVRTL